LVRLGMSMLLLVVAISQAGAEADHLAVRSLIV
jgi:hypothetical protein